MAIEDGGIRPSPWGVGRGPDAGAQWGAGPRRREGPNSPLPLFQLTPVQCLTSNNSSYRVGHLCGVNLMTLACNPSNTNSRRNGTIWSYSTKCVVERMKAVAGVNKASSSAVAYKS